MAKFGFGQVGKPTPRKWALFCEFGAGASSIIATWLVTAAYIPHTVSDVLSSILSGLFVPGFLLGKRLIGSDTEQTRVPIEEVSEIKEEQK